MEKVTQTTAATAEESAASSEELSAQAEQSMVCVRQLEELVGGTSEGRPPQAPGARARVVGFARLKTPQRGPGREYRRQAVEEPDHAGTGTYGRF
jgi:methyl-accepting chemotaxis protein